MFALPALPFTMSPTVPSGDRWVAPHRHFSNHGSRQSKPVSWHWNDFHHTARMKCSSTAIAHGRTTFADSLQRRFVTIRRHDKSTSMIDVEPIEFSWMEEWLPRVRASLPRMRAAMMSAESPAIAAARSIGEWQNETDAWLRSLSTKKQRDVVELLLAENDMLWETIYPSDGRKPVVDSDEFTDFRTRFYEGIPLALAIERLTLPRSGFVGDMWRQLRDFAEERNWLP
jgi:hypothetical protein